MCVNFSPKVNNVSVAPEAVPMSGYPEKLRGSRSYLDDESTNYDKPPYSDTPQWVQCTVVNQCVRCFMYCTPVHCRWQHRESCTQEWQVCAAVWAPLCPSSIPRTQSEDFFGFIWQFTVETDVKPGEKATWLATKVPSCHQTGDVTVTWLCVIDRKATETQTNS